MDRFTENERVNRDEKITRVRKICGDAEKFHDSISMQWGFDQDDLQNMDKFQEQLITEIHDVAPEQAEYLRIMIDRLNFNHLACLIHVSDRTRWLVFNEFIRRVREFLKDC
jgi:hypothetical protein